MNGKFSIAMPNEVRIWCEISVTSAQLCSRLSIRISCGHGDSIHTRITIHGMFHVGPASSPSHIDDAHVQTEKQTNGEDPRRRKA